MDGESVTIDAVLNSYRLFFSDIDRIRFGWLTVLIEHHASDVPSLVRVWGFRLSRRLREAIQQHHLPVRIEV